MKLWMLAAIAVVLSLATGCYPAVAQKNRVTCTGILSELDMNPHADFPMAVVYDNTDSPYYHTCVLDLGNAGHCVVLKLRKHLPNRVDFLSVGDQASGISMEQADRRSANRHVVRLNPLSRGGVWSSAKQAVSLCQDQL
jgi:hypothetical protein